MKSQIDKANKNIRELKENMPFLFVQYIEYKNAEKAYKDALIEYENKKSVWENLGK